MHNPQHLAPAAWAREFTCGLIAGAVALAYALSYAALLFPGALKHLLPIGVGLALVNAAIGSSWLAWRSQMPFALAGPDGNTTSILAAMAAGLAGTAAARGDATQVLVLVLGTTVLCALVFLALGIGRLGSAVRFVPYPVIGGFLAGSGWLILDGGLETLIGGPIGGDAIAVLSHADVLWKLALGGALVGLIALFHRLSSSRLVLPATIACAIVLFDLTVWTAAIPVGSLWACFG